MSALNEDSDTLVVKMVEGESSLPQDPQLKTNVPQPDDLARKPLFASGAESAATAPADATAAAVDTSQSHESYEADTMARLLAAARKRTQSTS